MEEIAPLSKTDKHDFPFAFNNSFNATEIDLKAPDFQKIRMPRLLDKDRYKKALAKKTELLFENVESNVQKSDLEKLFSFFGEIVLLEYNQGKNLPGHGKVVFASHESVTKAVRIDGFIVFGRKLFLNRPGEQKEEPHQNE